MYRLRIRRIPLPAANRMLLSILTLFLPGPISDASPLWNMRPGDSFVIDVLIARDSSVQFQADSPMRSLVTERLELEYRAENIGQGGTLAIRVRIRGGMRGNLGNESPDELNADHGKSGAILLTPMSDHRLSLLENVELLMDVAADGIVERLSAADRKALINRLGGLNTSTIQLLDECLTDDAVRAWFARPLWMFRDPAELSSGDSWDRSDTLSLGALGSLRVNARLLAAEPTAGALRPYQRILQISGNGRFVPSRTTRTLGTAELAAPIRFSAAQAELDTYSGQAIVSSAALSDARRPMRRPVFESLKLQFEFHGECQVMLGDLQRTARFRQHQSQEWALRSWRMGSPFLSDSGDFLIVPQPVPELEPEPD